MTLASPDRLTAVPRLSRVRVLVGASLWRAAPAVIGELSSGDPAPDAARDAARDDDAPPPVRALADAAAELRRALGSAESAAPASWGDAIGTVAIALQRAAGSDVSWCRAAPSGDPGGVVVAIEFEEERVGMEALELAYELLRDLVEGERVDVPRAVKDLRALREREHLGPTASVVVAEARRRGIPVRRVSGESLVQLGLGRWLHRIDATLTDRTSVIATDITSDKDRTKEVLGRLGLPVPRGGVARSVEGALDVADRIGFPVLVKPLDANNGRGISPRLDSEEAVREAFPRAQAEHPVVVIERFVEGHDHRVLVVDGKVVAVTERIPAHVIGDGRRTIRALAEEINLDPLRSKSDPLAPLAPLPLDAITEAFLALGGRTFDTVPGAGERVCLRSTANISTGGTPVDRTDDIHPENAAICAWAADATGLDVAGIDVLTTDIRRPFRDTGAAIVEVNASPGIRMHTEPSSGIPRDVPGAILDALFPPGTPVAVPVLAVTGTNGKTTTTRLLAHLFRQTGRRVGFTTTDGVYFQEHLLFEGDMTGPMAADMVLSNPRVDVAVLETARGGILRAGLGFAYCDTAVVLNVTPDHLGLRGIHTVEQLAEVKGVLVTAVRPGGHAVLNADDPLVVAMRTRTAGTVAFFSLGAPGERPHLAAHVAGGGTALCHEEGELVLYRSGAREPLLRVADVPLTLGGAATFQVQNALAAATAALVTGLDASAVREGLRTFLPSRETTPGRMNVRHVRGATFITDYAHNPAAIAALLDLVRRMPAARRIAVLSTPGDRRDEDFREIGRLATGMDHVIFKEHPHYRRGRPAGEGAALMREALLETGFPADHIGTADGEEDAVRQALAAMGEGDVVAFIADDQAVVDQMLAE